MRRERRKPRCRSCMKVLKIKGEDYQCLNPKCIGYKFVGGDHTYKTNKKRIKLERIVLEETYVFIKDFDTKNVYTPLRWFAKKGELAYCTGQSLGNPRFEIVDSEGKYRQVIMNKKEAFSCLRKANT